MNLEDSVINDAAKQMSDQALFQILVELLCNIGWTKVVLRPMTWEQGAEVDAWVELFVKQPHQTMGLVWVFEKEQEANWFSLRWVS